MVFWGPNSIGSVYGPSGIVYVYEAHGSYRSYVVSVCFVNEALGSKVYGLGFCKRFRVWGLGFRVASRKDSFWQVDGPHSFAHAASQIKSAPAFQYL